MVRAVDGLLESGQVGHVVVAVREPDLGVMRELFDDVRVSVVPGGVDRLSSVRAALRAGLDRHPDAHTVLVHDAARAITPASLVAELVTAIEAGRSAVVPVLPLADTVKQVDESGAVCGTADRSSLRAVQTPQAFRTDVLRRAYDAVPEDGAGEVAVTDDAGLVERLGEPVHTVPGHPLAFKITTPWDLRLAELLVGR